MSLRKALGCVIAFLLMSDGLALAQTGGALHGSVTDETSAVIPGATVAIVNLDTGAERSVITDENGRYRAPGLTVGNYQVTVSLAGFQTVLRRGIELALGQDAAVDVTLAVGALTDTVEVTSEVPMVETTNATLGGLVSEQQVRDLPLNARSLIDLVPMQAGVVFSDTASRDPNGGFGRKISIGGTRFSANAWQLDGTNINDRAGTSGSAGGGMMGVETIREFTVITNAYSAEYGRHTGGVFNAITKSGTNQMRGSAFEFLRDDSLDAKNFFDQGDPPPFSRHQFGATLGGPIFQNKTFFFASYEGLRERLGVTETYTVPSLAARQGVIGSAVTGVDPRIRPYLESFPLPNGTDFGDGRAEFIEAFTQPTDEDFMTARVDHTFGGRHSIFARYTMSDADRHPRSSFNFINDQFTENKYLTVSATQVLSPRLLNKVMFGYTYAYSDGGDRQIDGTTLPRQSFTDRTTLGGQDVFGALNVTGLSGWGGTAGPTLDGVDTYQIKDDLDWTKGRHALKFGFEVEKRLTVKLNSADPGGLYRFRSLSDFLRNQPRDLIALVFAETSHFRQWLYGFYMQDDFQMSSQFTLNLGLRYDPSGDFNDRDGILPNFRDDDVRTTLGLTVNDVSVRNPLFINPTAKNFAPRVGFAWSPGTDGKTSIRGGAGMFYHVITAGKDLGAAVGNLAPLRLRGELQSARVGRVDFPDAFFTQQAALVGAPRTDPFQWDVNQPYVVKWSLSGQREILPRTVVETAYAGMHGYDLLTMAQYNTNIAETRDGRLFIPQNAPLRHPTLARVRMVETASQSSYHSFRLSVNQRLTKGLQFQVAYTLSKAISDGESTGSDYSNDAGTPRYLNIRDRGLAAFDLRNNLQVNFSYLVPGEGPLRGGWTIGGIARFSSGNPFDVASGVQPSWFIEVVDFADLKPGAKANSIDPQNPNRYYDPTVFLAPEPGYIGNLGRNSMSAPGVANIDLVLAKEIHVAGRVTMDFRAEVFNVLNRPNFGLPSSNVFDANTREISTTAGRITNTTTTARQMQFGIRTSF